MDAMARTRESILHDAIREADRANDTARTFMAEMIKAADDAAKAKRYADRLLRVLRFATVVGGLGWLLAWALAVWGWVR